MSSPVSAGGHKARPYTAYNDNITTSNAFVLGSRSKIAQIEGGARLQARHTFVVC